MRFRPRVEALEAREVPAANTWLGGSSSTDDTAWSLGRVPISGDDLYFDGSIASTDCDFWSGDLTDYLSSVHLVNGYPGTVYFDGDMDIATLEVDSGAIAPYSGFSHHDIWVEEEVIWTGGTLNNTAHAGTLHILGGATANVSPGASNTVTTGYTLSFEGDAGTQTGSTGTFYPGTVVWKNDAHWFVSAESEVVFDLSNGNLDFLDDMPQGFEAWNNTPQQPHHIAGVWIVKDDAAVQNNAFKTNRVTVLVGTMIVHTGLEVNFDTPTGTAQASFNMHTAPQQNPPRAEFYTGTGSRMKVGNWASLAHGEVWIRPGPLGFDLVDSFGFVGNVSFGPQGEQGHDNILMRIRFTDDEPHRRLIIQGDCTMHHTDTVVNYDGSANDLNNRIIVSGTMFYFGKCIVTMLHAPGTEAPVQGRSYLVWRCISIDNAYDPAPPPPYLYNGQLAWCPRWFDNNKELIVELLPVAE
jgi:hypothetical protein